jgi:signal peptidase II
MKKLLLNYLGLVGGAGAIIALDQWTKALLRSHLAMGDSWSPWSWLSPFIQIVHIQNTGAAFSFGSGFGLFFTCVATVAAVAILYYYPSLSGHGPAMRAALVFFLGGTLGNLVDRLRWGQVTDFISIRYFAVVNVADISITVGCVLLLLYAVRSARAQDLGTEK